MQLKWPMLKDSIFKEHYKIPFENVDFNSSGLHLAILKTNPTLLGRKCLLEDQQSHNINPHTLIYVVHIRSFLKFG